MIGRSAFDECDVIAWWYCTQVHLQEASTGCIMIDAQSAKARGDGYWRHAVLIQRKRQCCYGRSATGVRLRKQCDEFKRVNTFGGRSNDGDSRMGAEPFSYRERQPRQPSAT